MKPVHPPKNPEIETALSESTISSKSEYFAACNSTLEIIVDSNKPVTKPTSRPRNIDKLKVSLLFLINRYKDSISINPPNRPGIELTIKLIIMVTVNRNKVCKKSSKNINEKITLPKNEEIKPAMAPQNKMVFLFSLGFIAVCF